MRRHDQYPCGVDGIAELHRCFACASGAATGENAATAKAANETDLICFLIFKITRCCNLLTATTKSGRSKNFDQFVEDALFMVKSRLEVLLQQALRFVDGLKN